MARKRKRSERKKAIKNVKQNFTFSFVRLFICMLLLVVLGGGYYFVYTSGVFESDTEVTGGAGELDANAPKLIFHMIDVGNADSLFVELPDGKTMMIDCGYSINTSDEYKYSTIYAYLTEIVGLDDGDTIDYIVNTHTDGDHYNGFVNLLRDFEIGEIWIPWVYTDDFDEWGSPTYEDNSGFTTFIEKSIEEVGIEKVYPIIADELLPISGDDYQIRFITPTEQFINEHVDTPQSQTTANRYNNAASAMMTLEFGNQVFVLTGDAEGITEDEFIDVISANYPTLFSGDKHVYLKVAHHGSNTNGSNGGAFLNFIEPEFAFISSGHDYNDAHPAAEIVEQLSVFSGNNIYLTKEIGNVTATLDGENIEINGVITKPDDMKTFSISGAFILAGIVVVMACFYKFNKIKY